MNIFFIAKQKFFLHYALMACWFLKKIHKEYSYHNSRRGKGRYRRHKITHSWQREIVVEWGFRKTLFGPMKLESRNPIWKNVPSITMKKKDKQNT